jgi:hypothetical protein
MRTVERNMVDTIKNRKCRKFGNTEIYSCNDTDAILVHLHGNLIAKVTVDSVTLYSAGWRTVTTKSRLNAILSGLGINSYIYQSQYQWYVRNITKGVIDTFYDGYTIERKHNGN